MVTANSTQYQEEEEEEEEEQLVPLSAYVNVILDETESEKEREQVQCHQLPAAATFDVKVPNPPVLDMYCKREEQFKWCQTLRLCKRNQMSPLRQQQQSALAIDYGGLIATVKHVNSKPPARQPDAKDFAEEEIDSDTAEVRAFNGQTTQLWFAVDQKKHAVNSTPELPQQSLQGVSTSALSETLPAHNMSGKDDNSTLDSDDDVFKKEDEDTYSENIDAAIQRMTRFGSYSTSDTHPSMSLAGQGTIGEREHGTSSHSGQESEKFGHDSKVAVSESGGLELELGKNASNRAINVWKARAMKEAMLENLIRLKFCEDVTRAALEAGVLEIYNYDLNCELAYVDIFMSLMKMVCDAHLDVISEVNNAYHSYMLHDENVSDHVQSSITHEDSPSSLEQHSFLPFKWPIIDMARFEFESARPGTCFNSVCVLTNLPQVSMDRMQELVMALSRNVFCMINDPIQVVMPSGSSTGRTRGCAFLEFCDPDTAQICAMAVDGLTWGRGSFARIRGKLFRQYYVTSPAAEDWYTAVMNDNNASSSCSLIAISGTGSLSHATPISSTVERHYSRTAQRFQLDSGAAQEQTLLCDNDEDDSDTGEWDIQHPLDYTQFDSLAISDLSSNSASELDEPSQHDIAIQLGSDDEVLNDENLMQQREKRESDCDGADDESIDSHSVVEFQGYDDERLMDDFLFKKLAREYLITPVSSGKAHAAPSSILEASAVRESHIDCGMIMQPCDVDCEGTNVLKTPWQGYCNSEMHEQMTFARHRIVQLSHNNRKLHLLIDRVERDRDSLLIENKVLQTQLDGYKDRERSYDFLKKELVLLQKSVTQHEHFFGMQTLDPLQQISASGTVSSTSSSILNDFRAALSHVTSFSLAHLKIEELKVWEQQLESILSDVRSIKEERALEMQKKLDRQVEEQNELKLCVICLSKEKSILCLPCRHLCLCKTCSRRQEVMKCPICRLEIEEMLAVYS